MKITRVKIAAVLPFILFFACDSPNKQQVKSEEATFFVQGSTTIDTSFMGNKDVPYDRYSISIQKIQKDIYIMTGDSSRIYPVSSYGAIKHVNKDSFFVATGVWDIYSEKLFRLAKEDEFTFPFYLPHFDFLPDTIFLDFVYYLDSLFIDKRFVEIPYTNLKPSYLQKNQ